MELVTWMSLGVTLILLIKQGELQKFLNLKALSSSTYFLGFLFVLERILHLSLQLVSRYTLYELRYLLKKWNNLKWKQTTQTDMNST